MTGLSLPPLPYVRKPFTAVSPLKTLDTPVNTRVPAVRKRKRNIACVICNRQKKKCGLDRPCARCVELKLPCTQPVKPEGYTYFTKKQKLCDEPTSPSNLWIPEYNEHLPQNFPSPSPTASTVGTPQPSHSSMSSYEDSAPTRALSGGGSDAFQPDCLDQCTKTHLASPGNTFVLTSTEEHPSKATPIWSMACWDLLPPSEEVPDEIVTSSKYIGAPIFGIENPIYGPEQHFDFAAFGEPMDIGDDCAGGDDLGIQKADDVDTIVWDPAWLDKVDFLDTDLVLDDVDLSDLDFPSDIFTDLGLHIDPPQQFSATSSPPEP